MRITDDGLLREFARKGRCEWCAKPSRGVLLDPHHLKARGMGGGGRLDIRINLVALCRACHDLVHGGHISRSDLLAMVSAREGCLQDDITREIARLRRVRK